MLTFTSNIAAKEMVMKALETLQGMQAAPGAPGWLKAFDPIAGHTPSTKQEGKSYFNADDGFEELREMMRNAKSIVHMRVKDGPRAAVIFTFHTEAPIGWDVSTTPVEEGEFEVRQNHGELQVFGPAVTVEQETHNFTVVLTPEDTGLALASVHPGIIDEEPNMEGLHDGDRLTFDDLKNRRIVRVNKI